jgi:site-specific DNA recombinase
MADSAAKRRLRCAIYTRKSSEEGLEQDFNSLDAQREACAAYIASQKHEGWLGRPTRFDDGGYSGGSMERPALRALLADITARKIDVVVVYKVDRLTRALTDFAKIVEVFDTHGVSFVSVTQAFNTTTSMGRLTLNVLLSFAQFEREVTGERIRDKIAASKKKGLWMGGFVPFGFRPHERTLVIEEPEAKIVRQIFSLYMELGTVRKVAVELERRALPIPARTTMGGRSYGAKSFSRGQLYKMLSNPIYCGEIQHKGLRHPGQHPAIISHDDFEAVARHLAANSHERKAGRNSKSPSLLAGLLVDEDGNKLVATHANKQGKRYRYYISKAYHEGRRRGRPGRDRAGGVDVNGRALWRLPASEIETIVAQELRATLSDRTRMMDIAKALCPGASWPMELRSRIEWAARDLAAELAQGDPPKVRDVLLKLVSRIEISTAAAAIVLDVPGSTTAFGLEKEGQDRIDIEPPRLTITVALRQRGVESKLVVTRDGQSTSVPDETMIRALARARRWMAELLDGTHGSVTDLAAAYATNSRYVARHLPLACLSPEIVQAILDGRHNGPSGRSGKTELTTWDLLNRIDIALDWVQQKSRLGFR